MDMKLKCIFEFTEEEQKKLQHLKQVSDAPSNTSQQQNATLANASGQKSTSSTNKQPRAADAYSSSADTHANDFESMTSLNTNAGTNANANANSNVATTNSRAGALAATGVAKTTTTATSASSSGQADSKNENTLNELKFYKQENEALKREVNRLKVSHGPFTLTLTFVYKNL